MQPNVVVHTATPTPTATPTAEIPVEALYGVGAVGLAVLTWGAFVIWLQNATGGRLP